MFKTKGILKIILFLQLLGSILATYANPDVEVFDVPNQHSRDQMLIDAAIKRGMDGEAVAELLRTKKPVVRTTITPTGFTKTTTYKLEPDGSISSKSVLKKRSQYVYNSDSIPDDLKNAPTGTVTRTFTDSTGNKVTQTVTINQTKPSPPINYDDLSGDWFSKSSPSWPEESSSLSTITKTYTSPKGERRTVHSWISDTDTDYSRPEAPNRISTSTRTYINPKGDKRVVQMTDLFNKPILAPIDDTNWPGFDYGSFSQPWDVGTPDDSNGWEVLDHPETTTTAKKNVEALTPKPFQWPDTYTTTTKPLPSLEDFLRRQYAEPNKETTTSTEKSSTVTSPIPRRKVIKIEDLPVTEVLYNGKPADKNILNSLPAHLTPTTPREQVLNIEHLKQNSPTAAETNIRTYSKTVIGPEKPKLKDLDPRMQDILKKAGIVPEIEGDITKTRTEPDGRVITTSYKVDTLPYQPVQYTPPLYSHSLNSPTNQNSPISEFLAKFGLTKFDISSRNGRYSKTYIDEDGDVLTVAFLLSSPKKLKTLPAYNVENMKLTY